MTAGERVGAHGVIMVGHPTMDPCFHDRTHVYDSPTIPGCTSGYCRSAARQGCVLPGGKQETHIEIEIVIVWCRYNIGQRWSARSSRAGGVTGAGGMRPRSVRSTGKM